MQPEDLKDLLEGMRSGATSLEEALAQLRRAPVEDLGFARLDQHRELRQGFPEAIYAESKTTDEVVAIAERLVETTGSAVMATRCPGETVTALLDRFPDAIHHERARLVVVRRAGRAVLGTVAIVTAGTSDLPVAEEASGVLDGLRVTCRPVTDVGVAGIHRILSAQEDLQGADVVIVVAGMEGALPSVVGGMVAAPVIAVPTSVGYGASFDGLAALLGMLNSCAAGVTVTNIDNGFGAAIAAVRILNAIAG
jgi:NCAIR mutase (PurE)-related protein